MHALLGTIEREFDYAVSEGCAASRVCDDGKPCQILISLLAVEPVGEFELKGIRATSWIDPSGISA
jgi:hypothetical protein